MSVKLLIDMNLTPAWREVFANAGLAAVHWSEVGDPAAPDGIIMEWARANGYAVFTHDLDFGAALALTGAAGPSVIQYRGRDVLPEAIGTPVLETVCRYTNEIERGALVVIDRANHRVRLLPLER